MCFAEHWRWVIWSGHQHQILRGTQQTPVSSSSIVGPCTVSYLALACPQHLSSPRPTPPHSSSPHIGPPLPNPPILHAAHTGLPQCEAGEVLLTLHEQLRAALACAGAGSAPLDAVCALPVHEYVYCPDCMVRIHDSQYLQYMATMQVGTGGGAGRGCRHEQSAWGGEGAWWMTDGGLPGRCACYGKRLRGSLRPGRMPALTCLAAQPRRAVQASVLRVLRATQPPSVRMAALLKLSEGQATQPCDTAAGDI